MDKHDIVEELDRLKLKTMIDESLPDNDLDRYEDWIDKMQLRVEYSFEPWSYIGNEQYARFKTVRSIVQDLFHRKHSGTYEYAKNQPEIKRTIEEAVAMTLFCLDEIDK